MTTLKRYFKLTINVLVDKKFLDEEKKYYLYYKFLCQIENLTTDNA